MTGENRIKGMLRLRDITRALIDAQVVRRIRRSGSERCKGN